MAETVKLPGVKKGVPKNVIYVGGAAALGIVGYAWWTRGVSAEDEGVVPELPEPVPEPTDEPGFTVTGTTVLQTNGDWTELAVERLSNRGVSATALYAALGRFLARLPLSKTDADLVRQAIAAAGMPPQGEGWTVIEESTGGNPPPPSTVKLGAPVGFKATGGKGYAQLSWRPASGHVTHYEYRRMDSGGWVTIGNVTSHRANAQVAKNTFFQYAVRAVGPGNVKGPHVYATAKVLR